MFVRYHVYMLLLFVSLYRRLVLYIKNNNNDNGMIHDVLQTGAHYHTSRNVGT